MRDPGTSPENLCSIGLASPAPVDHRFGVRTGVLLGLGIVGVVGACVEAPTTSDDPEEDPAEAHVSVDGGDSGRGDAAPDSTTGLRPSRPPFANPVIATDCPDPGVFGEGNSFYVVCTGGSFPIRSSPDLVN